MDLKPSLVLCLALAACPSQPGDPPPIVASPPPGPPSAQIDEAAPAGPFAPVANDDLAVLVKANETFATRLYGKLRRNEGNLALSPASIAVALGMTYAGARDETAAEMKRALALETDASATHAGFGTLLRSWQVPSKMPFELRVANRLFASKHLEPRPEFVEVTKDYYSAPLEEVPFESDPDDAREHINAYIAEATEQKIENLLPPGSIDPATRLVLTNAIYFKGSWAAPFDEKGTGDADFHAPGGTVTVPTMHQKAFFRYAEADDAKLLEMAYRGGRLAMMLVLPNARDGLAAVETRLESGALAAWVGALARFEVQVALPRFTIDPAAPLALSPALTEMGMTAVFDPARANLRGIAEPPPGQNLFLSQVFHKAFVEVNEVGTEAAAATGSVVSVTSMPLEQPDPKTFIADHPFLFFIRDLETQALLFMGRVTRP